MKVYLKRLACFQIFAVIGLIFSLGSVQIAKAEEISAKKLKAILRQDRQLKPLVLNLAVKAYLKSDKTKITKPIITVIDYSLPSAKKRLWVLNLNRGKILYTSLVAHGQNSGQATTASVSNRLESHQTSVGLFLTGKTYLGKDGYSLRLHGLERGFNDNAYQRGIVVHGANYVSKKYARNIGRIGRSWGCPAVEMHLAKPIIDTICDGTLLFSFYPDELWLKHSSFASL